MLTTNLQELWDATPSTIRTAAITRARAILANLTHYPTKPQNYYTDDVERLAAELVAVARGHSSIDRG